MCIDNDALNKTLSEFYNARFGYYDDDKNFIELGDDYEEFCIANNISPLWVGGTSDTRLITAFVLRYKQIIDEQNKKPIYGDPVGYVDPLFFDNFFDFGTISKKLDACFCTK